MVICAIVGCSKRSVRDNNVSFYRIPCVNMKRNYKYYDLILKRQKLWLTRIKREDLDERKVKHARICSLHFVSGKPSSLLDQDNPDWAPSVNLGYERTGNAAASHERYQRRLQRMSNSISINDDASNHSDIDEADQTNEARGSDNVESENSATAEIEKTDAACMTDLSLKDLEQLEAVNNDYSALQIDYFNLKKIVNFSNISLDNFDNNDQINFYTGLENSKLLKEVFHFVAPYVNSGVNNKLTKFQEFILFLVRMRLNLLTQDLGYRFNVSQETVCRIFNKWLNVMYHRLKRIVFWPEREVLLKTMPLSFRSAFDGHVAVIVDCFEIVMNRPSSLSARAATWSNYKQRNTAKFLIGITPQGTISFISLGSGGRTTDKYLIEDCGILNNLLPGDVILADRGFNNVDSAGFFCAKLILPASARGKKQLDPIDVENTRKIASLRIHVERVIGHLKTKFRILKGVLPIEMCDSPEDEDTQIDKIVRVCAALINLMPSIVPLK